MSNTIRCAIYTRKSTEDGLEQDFNSLDGQREARLAYIKSQHHEGWRAIRKTYDDGGISGATLNRPAMKHLIKDVKTDQIDTVVVYKVDRLTRSLADFSKLIELFDEHSVSFISVTQQFNTTSSMGRLTLNVLLSFAQFEREINQMDIQDKENTFRKLIKQVNIDRESISIRLNIIEFIEQLKITNLHFQIDDAESISIKSPHNMKRRGVEKKIILPGTNTINKDQNLMALIARSYRWIQDLNEGRVNNITEISANENMDNGDVSRFI